MTRDEALGRLKAAPWLNDAGLKGLLVALGGATGRTRVVGGVVRDTLLGRVKIVADIDMATELVPGMVTERAQEAGFSVYPTGIEHGTVTVVAGATHAEVTTLRQDIATDGRRARVRFGTDWTHDASRRDFTLNALYAEMDGTLFDPLGGLGDCLEGRVRFIGEAGRRIAEDRLRVYRFFRFSASHGGERFDVAGLAACRAAAADLGGLSGERVGMEMRKILDLPSVAHTLQAMGDAGIAAMAPAVLSAIGRYDHLTTRPDVAARLALIFTRSDRKALAAAWRLPNKLADRAAQILAGARALIAGQVNLVAYRYGREQHAALEVAASLESWSGAARDVLAERLTAVGKPVFPLGGDDLIARGMSPGPALGKALGKLEAVWIDSGFALTGAQLLARLEDRG